MILKFDKECLGKLLNALISFDARGSTPLFRKSASVDCQLTVVLFGFGLTKYRISLVSGIKNMCLKITDMS